MPILPLFQPFAEQKGEVSINAASAATSVVEALVP